MAFSFGAGGIKEDPKKQSKVGPTGISTPPNIFPSFLLGFFFRFLFPCRWRVNKYGTKSVPDAVDF